MKFILSNNPTQGFRVRLEGDEIEQNCFATLAENLDAATTFDTWAGKVCCFESNKSFKKFLQWRAIFGQCSPNKTFNFKKFAREAVSEVREILGRDTKFVDNRVLEG